jgi:hypothetical protein
LSLGVVVDVKLYDVTSKSRAPPTDTEVHEDSRAQRYDFLGS